MQIILLGRQIGEPKRTDEGTRGADAVSLFEPLSELDEAAIGKKCLVIVRAEPYVFQSKTLHRPARTNELHVRMRASGLYRVFNPITLTFGSGACIGTSICSLFSVWRKVNCFPLASKRADITFAVSPGSSNTPVGQSKT